MRRQEKIALNKQVHIYSVDTSFFYNKSEQKIYRKQNRCYLFRNELNKRKNNKNYQSKEQQEKIKKHLEYINKRIKILKNKLYVEFSKNNKIRTLNVDWLSAKHIISIFESVLTRTLQIRTNSLSTEIFVVQTYYFDILKDIILNGFIFDNEKYICLTASAGQIRTKKTVFIKEKTFEKYKNTLTCGLSVEDINKQGGVNINKYLAYLALSNSATDEWKDFDINKTIVVDDLETIIRTVVDFIDEKTYEITRKEMDIPINHTDGCGMILPQLSKKSFMVRLPWMKGLLVSVPFDLFAKKFGKYIVKDIYGKEYDIIKDNIQIIFTKSQFKMWRYYKSWNEYKENFIKYKCQAGICNEEEDQLDDKKLNYQMLQTLTDIENKELYKLASTTRNNILNIGRDRNTMLRVLGVVDSSKPKNYMQQALSIYPELLHDTYSKEILKQTKRSLVKEARAGKLNIKAKYCFVTPDVYAFCEFLFLGDVNPKGLLKNGEVYCSLYKNGDKLDVLRSPHLYREHAIRTNVLDYEKKKWFITKGIYTSIHDPISKLLMFDNDGDKVLVAVDYTLVSVAERNMKNIVPLFYNMATANKEIINNLAIYNGLKTAYTGGNIGVISNEISKIWNSDNINLDVVKFLVAENNFVIDFAKTLYKPIRPEDKKHLITQYSKMKVPHFFIYAKNKHKKDVEQLNYSTVNRLEKIIPNPRINFRISGLEKFDYRMLMSGENVNVDLNKSIIDKYTELDSKSHFMIPRDNENDTNSSYMFQEIKNALLSINNDVKYVVDVLIEYLYKYKNSSYKVTLWECFGDVIVENLKRNLEKKYGKDIVYCESCRDRMKDVASNKKYCDKCLKNHRRNYKREKQDIYRKIKNVDKSSKLLSNK